MPTFDAGAIVRVPFPYTDRPVRQRRPAVVISRGPIGREGSLVWVAMITSSANAGWPNDIPLPPEPATTGLTVESLIRPDKIATIEATDAEALGRLPAETLDALSRFYRRSVV